MSQMSAITQVWARFYNLPLEYKHAQNIFSVARGIGIPLKIDPRIINLNLRIYARVLTKVDLLLPPPKKF